jgi:hypothetical protein
VRCRCGAHLGQVNKRGEPMVRTAGMIMQDGGGMAMVCPRCKSDVPFTPDFAKALQTRLVLLFKGPTQ